MTQRDATDLSRTYALAGTRAQDIPAADKAALIEQLRAGMGSDGYSAAAASVGEDGVIDRWLEICRQDRPTPRESPIRRVALRWAPGAVSVLVVLLWGWLPTTRIGGAICIAILLGAGVWIVFKPTWDQEQLRKALWPDFDRSVPCVKCGSPKARWIDTKEAPHMYFTTRYKCRSCGHRWEHAGWAVNVRMGGSRR